MSIRVLLADDHKIVREGLRSLLEKQPDIEILGEAENGRMALQLAEELAPDVLVMDIGMPDLNGIEATRKILAMNRSVRVVALSMHSDKRFVAGMFRAGAIGYVLKESAFDELVNAIRAAASNQMYVSPKLTGGMIRDYIRSLEATLASSTPLTAREREVLQLLAEGKTTKQIANHLQVSVKTIETYRQRIMEKLNLYSIAEITKYALREGITFLE